MPKAARAKSPRLLNRVSSGQSMVLWPLLFAFYKRVFVNFTESTLKSELKVCSSYIELGCGRGSPAVPLIHGLRTVGIDAYLPSLRANKSK